MSNIIEKQILSSLLKALPNKMIAKAPEGIATGLTQLLNTEADKLVHLRKHEGVITFMILPALDEAQNAHINAYEVYKHPETQQNTLSAPLLDDNIDINAFAARINAPELVNGFFSGQIDRAKVLTPPVETAQVEEVEPTEAAKNFMHPDPASIEDITPQENPA